MKIVHFDANRPIGDFGSREATVAGVARVRGRAQVGCVRLGPGGLLGAHKAVGAQLFLVVDGVGWTRANGERIAIGRGQGVLWGDGEWHETGTADGLTAIVVEADEIELIQSTPAA